jgi:predicted deacetylase
MLKRTLCITLHDVAPSTWPECRQLLGLIDSCGDLRVTLLVVPEYHGRTGIDRDTAFRHTIDTRLARGDEVALHGLRHRDEAAPSRSPADWFRRRILTANEGEFAALTRAEATSRIERGLELLQGLGWPVRGFVAPAWLMSAGTRSALQASGLDYATTHTALLDLRGELRIQAPCLTASPHSPWRRAASRFWLERYAMLTKSTPLVRLGLHPADAHHAGLVAQWKDLIARLGTTRDALTKSQALDRFAVRTMPK